MKVFIIKKFDSRDIGTSIDVHESIAEKLISKGFVSTELKTKELEKKEFKQSKSKSK